MNVHRSFLLLSGFILFFFFASGLAEAAAAGGDAAAARNRPWKKLFVFGDSYADTGNLGNIGRIIRSWYFPYGKTFPRRPSGRFSDGRVLTDFVAKMMGLKSPLPYKDRRGVNHRRRILYGMNFAVGGSGVFDQFMAPRNLSAQIQTFEQEIKEGRFSPADVADSVALVAISGNDYSHLAGKDLNEVLGFVKILTGEMATDLRRLPELGVGKVLVTAMHPLGCVPYITRANNYTACDATADAGAAAHNAALARHLRHEIKHGTFLFLDLYDVFNSFVRRPVAARRFKKTLRPCCESTDSLGWCGLIDENGAQRYTLCGNPASHFYWDDVHPTQAGWEAVAVELRRPIAHFLGL